MRTLLNESFPPNCMDEPMFFPPEPAARIFSQGAVLGKLDDLVEVVVGETVMATSSASHHALERGVAFSKNSRSEAASVSARHGCADHKQTEGAVSP
jgi:hypothetical protein